MNAPVETLLNIPLSNIVESPTNPRKRFDLVALQELADSIKGKGLIEPAIVRQLPDGSYELVVGARRYRASGLAGCTTLLCIVRVLTDREVCEIQLEENGQREGVHPLEEADAYEHLRAQGAELAELAARTGKSVGYVEQRLRLAALIPAAREAFLDGKMLAGIAALTARLTPERQAKATEAFLGRRPYYGGDYEGVWTVADAARWIRREFHHRLAQAPFDVADAALVPTAGSCTLCPKNTAAQGTLFEDLRGSEAECTDPMCWKSKETQTWANKTAAAKASGAKVLTPDEAANVVQQYGGPSKGFVRLTDKPADIGSGRKTWAEILKKSPPQVTVAVDSTGAVQELVAPADLKVALKANKVERKKPERSTARSGGPDDGLSWQERQERRNQMETAVATAVHTAALSAKVDLEERTWWVWLSKCVARAWPDALHATVERQKLNAPKGKRHFDHEEAAFDYEAESRTAAGNRALIAEVMARVAMDQGPANLDDDLIKHVTEFYRVDVKAVVKRLDAERETEEAAKKAAAKPGKAAKSTSPPTPAKPAPKPGKAPKKPAEPPTPPAPKSHDACIEKMTAGAAEPDPSTWPWAVWVRVDDADAAWKVVVASRWYSTANGRLTADVTDEEHDALAAAKLIAYDGLRGATGWQVAEERAKGPVKPTFSTVDATAPKPVKGNPDCWFCQHSPGADGWCDEHRPERLRAAAAKRTRELNASVRTAASTVPNASAKKLHRDESHTVDIGRAQFANTAFVTIVAAGRIDTTVTRQKGINDEAWRLYVDELIAVTENVTLARMYSQKGKCIWDSRDGGKP